MSNLTVCGPWCDFLKESLHKCEVSMEVDVAVDWTITSVSLQSPHLCFQLSCVDGAAAHGDLK